MYDITDLMSFYNKPFLICLIDTKSNDETKVNYFQRDEFFPRDEIVLTHVRTSSIIYKFIHLTDEEL